MWKVDRSTGYAKISAPNNKDCPASSTNIPVQQAHLKPSLPSTDTLRRAFALQATPCGGERNALKVDNAFKFLTHTLTEASLRRAAIKVLIGRYGVRDDGSEFKTIDIQNKVKIKLPIKVDCGTMTESPYPLAPWNLPVTPTKRRQPSDLTPTELFAIDLTMDSPTEELGGYL